MHRRELAAVVVSTVLSLAIPCVSIAQTAGMDSATGSGVAVDLFHTTWNFDFNASSGPSGEAASGLLTTSRSNVAGVFTGPGTCLFVNGNRAVIGFNVTDSFIDGGY